MRSMSWKGALLLASAASASAWTAASTLETDILAARGLVNLAAYEAEGHFQPNCSLKNVAVRKEWTSLSNPERKAYTDAVLCLMSKPAKTDPVLSPGAKTRYDDFVSLHMNQTFSIHGTAKFLSWHRMFVWSYENALRDECGYKGYQPYWNWGKTAFDPVNSPMFDGSPYSMSGNGVYEPHNCTNFIACIPAGQGGGCVKTGPFKNMTVNLGPVAPTLAEAEVVAVPFLSYNPRCLKRDVSVWVSSQWSRDIDSATLIKNKTNIVDFQTYMQGNFSSGFFGVHVGGHFTIGGDPGGDFFASPGDPAFYLHHTQIDRTWWIWQNQDLKNRQNAIGGLAASGLNGTLQDSLDMGVTGPSTIIADVMSTVGGEMCYIYA